MRLNWNGFYGDSYGHSILLEFLADEVLTGVVGDIFRRSNVYVDLAGL